MSGDSRVEVDSYIVRPTGYDELAHSDKDSWCLHVVNGHAFGWSVRPSRMSISALNRKGEWVYETSGSRSNKFRRWSADEAIALALKYVDTLKINGYTAAEASTWVARVERESAGGSSAPSVGFLDAKQAASGERLEGTA